jgi:drug/metabolite transporter (DMT)-like permease
MGRESSLVTVHRSIMNDTPAPARQRAFWMALVSALLFGMATPFSKSLLASIHPGQLAGLLYLGAALFYLPAMILQRRRGLRLLPAGRKNQGLLLGAVFFGGMLGPVLLLTGLQLSASASMSMWLNLETVATAVVAVLLFREHLGRWTWVGNLGILAAGALLGFDGGLPGWTGLLCAAGACAAWGLDNNMTAVIDGITPQATTFWKGLAAGTVNLGVGLWLSPLPSAGGTAFALVLGGLSYGASIALYISAAQALGATRSQMVFASSPFFGVLLSVVWLGEGMSLLQGAALLVLVVSLAAMFLDQHGHGHHHHPVTHVHEHRHDDLHHDHIHDAPVRGRHVHEHAHDGREHAHPHWPDLHHRHDH